MWKWLCLPPAVFLLGCGATGTGTSTTGAVAGTQGNKEYSYVPTIEVDSRLAGLIEIKNWQRTGQGSLRGEITKATVPIAAFDLRCHFYDKEGLELENSPLRYPTLQPGETGECYIASGKLDEAARIFIRDG
jgi:hypothetical protein